MKSTKKKLGFSILETVLVVTIIAVLIGLIANYYTNTQIRADINAQASTLANYLRLSNSSAIAGLNDQSHGLHFTNSQYTIFQGDFFNPADPANFTISLPDTINIDPISLNGGGADVIFSKLNGETANYGTVTLTSPAINKSIAITIGREGAINY